MTKNVTIKQLSGGREVLLSYGVAVAAFIPGLGYVKSDRRYSVTTSKHANTFYRDGQNRPVVEVPATEFEQLIREDLA